MGAQADPESSLAARFLNVISVGAMCCDHAPEQPEHKGQLKSLTMKCRLSPPQHTCMWLLEILRGCIVVIRAK